MDESDRKKLKTIYPPLRARLYRLIDSYSTTYSKKLKVTQGLRTFEEQDALYQKGRTAPGQKVTNAKAGQSWHNFGLACDFCFYGSDPYLEKEDQAGAFYWMAFGRMTKLLGMQWGYDFETIKDMPHIQQSFGLSLKEANELYQYNGLAAVWYRLDQLLDIEPGTQWALKSLADPYGLPKMKPSGNHGKD